MPFNYDLGHKFRGRALIIGNEFKGQPGRELSCQENVRMMKAVFKKLDFNVTTFMNLTTAKMRDKLDKASKDENNIKSDCFVFSLSTHGNEKRPDEETMVPSGATVWQNVVFGEDQEPLLVDDIIDYFTDKNAVGLAGKPKLFFLMACRSRATHVPSPGDWYDQGVEVNVTPEVQVLTDKLKDTDVRKDSADLVHTMDLTDAEDIYEHWAKDPEEWDPEKAASSPSSRASEQDAAGRFSEEDADFDLVPVKCPDDFLIMYPVMSGKASFQNPVNGSYMIQFLHKDENLSKLLCGCNVLQYLTHVCHDMAEYEYKPSLQYKASDDLKTMMFRNIKYLSREDNQDMLVTVIGQAHEKELRGDVAIVEPKLKCLIRETLTEQQMKDILEKILPFKMTACLLHRLRGNVVFQPKKEKTQMGILKSEIMKKAQYLKKKNSRK